MLQKNSKSPKFALIDSLTDLIESLTDLIESLTDLIGSLTDLIGCLTDLIESLTDLVILTLITLHTCNAFDIMWGHFRHQNT